MQRQWVWLMSLLNGPLSLPPVHPLVLSVSWTSYKNWILDFQYGGNLSQWPLEVLQPKKNPMAARKSIFPMGRNTKRNTGESHVSLDIFSKGQKIPF